MPIELLDTASMSRKERPELHVPPPFCLIIAIVITILNHLKHYSINSWQADLISFS